MVTEKYSGVAYIRNINDKFYPLSDGNVISYLHYYTLVPKSLQLKNP